MNPISRGSSSSGVLLILLFPSVVVDGIVGCAASCFFFGSMLLFAVSCGKYDWAVIEVEVN